MEKVINVLGHEIKVNEVFEPRMIVGGANSIEKALLCNGLIKNLTNCTYSISNLILLQVKNGKVIVVERPDEKVKDKILIVNLFTQEGVTLTKSDIIEIKESIEKYINNNNVIKVKLHSIDRYDEIENVVVTDKAKSVIIGDYTPKLYEIWNRKSCNIDDDEFKSYIETFEKTFNNLTLIEFVKDEVYAFVPKSKFLNEDVKIILKVVDPHITLTKDNRLIYNGKYIKIYEVKKALIEKAVNVYKRTKPNIVLTFVDAISPTDKLKAKLLELSKDDGTYIVTLNNETYNLKNSRLFRKGRHGFLVESLTANILSEITEISEIKTIWKSDEYRY